MNRCQRAVTVINIEIIHLGINLLETVHQVAALNIRINHIIAAQALQVHHQIHMAMSIAEAIQADHHITAARVLMIHMMKDMMISI